MSKSRGHVPVMPDEVLELLNLSEGGSVADLTLGAGGHAELVLQATAPDGMLIGFDRDRDELAATEQRLVQFANRMNINEKESNGLKLLFWSSKKIPKNPLCGCVPMFSECTTGSSADSGHMGNLW